MAKKYLDYNGTAYFWQKIKNALLTKVDKVDGKTLSSNDYTAEEKAKLAGIAAGAEVNVNADWNATTGDSAILNKPVINDYFIDSNSVTGGTRYYLVNSNDINDRTHFDIIADGGVDVSHSSTDHKSTIGLVDATSSAHGAMSANDKNKLDHILPAILFATCTTAAATAAKVATIQEPTDQLGNVFLPFILTAGMRVLVKFTNIINVASATLNVNDTGAKPIFYNGAALGKGLTDANGTYEFYYDGTNWELIGDLDTNTTYSALTQSDATTGTATNSRLITAKVLHDTIAEFGGAAGGFAPLDANSKIDSTYLPSFVDDVIEAYPVSGATALSAGWLSDTSGGTALTPESGKIYILMTDTTDYAANTQFRWSGSSYVKMLDGGISSITNAEIDTIVAS